MPYVDIKTLPLPSDIDRAKIMRDLIQALAEAISTPAARIFAGWTTYDLHADGLNVEASFQRESHPPIVSIDMFEGRTKAQKVEALEAIAALLRRELDFLGHPFVYIRDIANAHITTGGRVVDKDPS